MLVHHSLKDPNRGASGRAATDPTLSRNESTRPGSAGRASPLKFFASNTRQRHAPPAEPPKELPKTEEPAKKEQPGAVRKRWTMDYLTELRKPVGARPMGARPPPGRNSVGSLDLPPRASSALSARANEQSPERIEQLKSTLGQFGSQRSQSALGHNKDVGRPLAREPDVSIMEDIAKTTAKMDNISVEIDGRKSPMPYYERGQRWMERQESKSLRAAMEYMDLEEEKRVHAAAQDEAADLVWKHKYAGKPYENPEAFKQGLKDHLREGSHARSQSIGPFQTMYVTKNGATDGKRSASGGSASNRSETSGRNRVVSTSSEGSNNSASSSGSRRFGSMSLKNSAGKILGSIRGDRGSRGNSNGRHSGLFSNPADRIYEEPESITESSQGPQQAAVASKGPLSPRSRNPSGTYRSLGPKSDLLAKTSFFSENKVSSIDIHKNPPSQSRDPAYTRNSATPPASEEQGLDKPPTKNGIEIRSDDIRAATSRRLKDRSEGLPTPTYVSDSPGRPIVSFESAYKQKETNKPANNRPSSREKPLAGARPLPGKPQMPASTASAPTVPKINPPAIVEPDTVQPGSRPRIMVQEERVPEVSRNAPAIPTINVGGVSAINVDSAPDVPVINVCDSSSGPVPVPSINIGGPETSAAAPARPAAPPHTRTAPASNPVLRGHWSPAVPRIGGAACCTCGLHIQGRTLSAAGQRFHPECFNCFQCGINLEHVAFYPEPDNAKEERFARENADSISRELDQRFFCHLDFHELYSPRCKSCKTPIEGEVIIACGSQWHQGHFFCAQCGDPFDGSTPFIEKDGWAWCVGCYKGRYSGKCRGCKKPVIEDGVKALGAEWHADCFRCSECNGPFEDGKFFTRGAGENPVCVKCEERRLKA